MRPWTNRTPGDTPSLSELTAQVDVLTKALTENDLPRRMAVLQRKLEANWQPDAGVLLQPGSVTANVLAPASADAVALGVCRGQTTAVGTGVEFADIAVTDNFGTAAKLGIALRHIGGTYTADTVVCNVQATATNTTTFRVITRNAGVIAVGLTVFIDYWIWKA